MKKALFAALTILLLSGCFDTHFNFQTIVRSDGSLQREVRIDGRGADRFLAPVGSRWKVRTFKTQGGQSIFDDAIYHIHAKGHFAKAEDITNDFHYDTSTLIENLTDEVREELGLTLESSGAIAERIGTQARVELRRDRSLWRTRYEYKETLEIHALVGILVHDLKKEILSKRWIAIPVSVDEGVTETQASEVLDPTVRATKNISPSSLSGKELTALARQKLVEDILPRFRFHLEISLPGALLDSNASQVVDGTAIWDFDGTDFKNDYTLYELHVSSKASRVGASCPSGSGCFCLSEVTPPILAVQTQKELTPYLGRPMQKNLTF